MEYWDLYDYKGKKKDKIAIRGTKLNNDDFHLVINAWIVNDNGDDIAIVHFGERMI